jgi:hypothetical protein
MELRSSSVKAPISTTALSRGGTSRPRRRLNECRPKLALEAIDIEQSQEELEILRLAVVRSGGHQQELTGDASEKLT